MKTRLVFMGAGLWDGGDEYPYDDTPFPRIPCVGEHISLPDDLGLWRVVDVTYVFAGGLGVGEPTVRIICKRAPTEGETR